MGGVAADWYQLLTLPGIVFRNDKPRWVFVYSRNYGDRMKTLDDGDVWSFINQMQANVRADRTDIRRLWNNANQNQQAPMDNVANTKVGKCNFCNYEIPDSLLCTISGTQVIGQDSWCHIMETLRQNSPFQMTYQAIYWNLSDEIFGYWWRSPCFTGVGSVITDDDEGHAPATHKVRISMWCYSDPDSPLSVYPGGPSSNFQFLLEDFPEYIQAGVNPLDRYYFCSYHGIGDYRILVIQDDFNCQPFFMRGLYDYSILNGPTATNNYQCIITENP